MLKTLKSKIMNYKKEREDRESRRKNTGSKMLAIMPAGEPPKKSNKPLAITQSGEVQKKSAPKPMRRGRSSVDKNVPKK